MRILSARISKTIFGVFSCLALLTIGINATEIQLSPNVGNPGYSMYRAASYRRIENRYKTRSLQDYNIKVDNLHLALTATMDVRWDDNVNQSKHDEESDLSIEPGLQLNVYWPLNPNLIISSGISMSYRYYTGDDGEDGFRIGGTDGALSAQIMADLNVGQNGSLTLSEEYSHDIDTIDIRATDANANDYALSRNTIGLEYSNELRPDLTGTAKLTHTNQWADDSDYDTHDYYSDFIDVVLLKALNRSFQVGPYARAGLYRYTKDKHNDSEEYDAGLAFVYEKTEQFSLSGSIGWQKTAFDDSNAPAANDEESNVTYELAARYASSEYLTHLLTLDYGVTQGTLPEDVNYNKQLGINYTFSWEIHKNVVLNGHFGYVNSRESDGGENADFYSAGIGTGYRLTAQSTVSIYYTHEWKESDMDDEEYAENWVELSLAYRF